MGKILLGVCGGIAAYKAAELARLFVRGGDRVQAVMTPSATRFVDPLTFRALTGNPVPVEMYPSHGAVPINHISLADDAEVIVVAPATATTVARLAFGLADNLLSAVCLAATCPLVVVPSMNVNMFGNPAFQDNLITLRSRGHHVMEPHDGALACGVYGRGRMPEPADIHAFTRFVLMPNDYQGLKALVTAGPTREALDPVRFLSNPSSGRMGYALARALAERGAEVVLVSGPTALVPPAGVRTLSVISAKEMAAAVRENYPPCRLVIKAAAVSDFRPREQLDNKVKKEKASLVLELERTPDILASLGRDKGRRVLVGFAAETNDLLASARTKLKEKNLDLIVANDLTDAEAGFASPTNRVTLVKRSGATEALPLMDKEKLAHLILDRLFSEFAAVLGLKETSPGV